MKDSIINKLTIIKEQYHSIGNQLSDEATQKNNKLMVELSKEISRIEPVVKLFEKYLSLMQEQENTTVLITEKDGDLQALAKEEIEIIDNQLQEIEQEILPLLLTDDPRDKSDIYLEIRAGTGGQEAAIFAGDIFRMYARYCEEQNWSVEILNQNESGQGGFKEIIARVLGQGVFSKLKFESGTHRVQRIPKTESQGRVHTSTCTVAIIPVVDKIKSIKLIS